MGGLDARADAHRLTVLCPGKSQGGVTDGDNATLHVGGVTLAHFGSALQRSSEDRLAECRLWMVGELTPPLGRLEGGDFLHAPRVLGVEDERALGLNSDRGRGDSLTKAVDSPTLVDPGVGVPEAPNVQGNMAEIIDGVNS